MKTMRLLNLLVLLSIAFGAQAFANINLTASPGVCLGCHGDVISAEEFAASVHGMNGCVACHIELTDVDLHKKGDLMPEPVRCVRCHKKETAEHYASIHKLNEIECAICHSEIHSQKAWKGDKRIAVSKCAECHDDAHAVFHEIGARQGASWPATWIPRPATTATICMPSRRSATPKTTMPRAFHTNVCMKCHGDES